MPALPEILATYKKHPPCAANGIATPVGTDPTEAAKISERQNAWQRLIDEKLIEWGRHPEQFEDEDGYKAPSADNLVRATEFVLFCRDHDVAPARRVAPDGEGGLVFEWYDGTVKTYVEIHADGSKEYLMFDDCKLIGRSSI
jgi:hypothetical protein